MLSTHIRSFKKYTSLLLSVIIVLQMFSFITISAVNENIALSDCSGGWQYSGNSTINYSVSGTTGTALEVIGARGTLRPLSYSFSPIDVTQFSTIEWDMRAVSAVGEDVLPDILKAYSDSFYLKLTDKDGKEYCYSVDEINFILIENGWYHAKALLPGEQLDLENIIKFSVSTLQNNAFCETLPQTYFRIDSPAFVKESAIQPEISGIQINGNEELRVVAKVNRAKYELLKENSYMTECGFIIGEVRDFSKTPLKLGEAKPYKNYPANQLQYLAEDEQAACGC